MRFGRVYFATLIAELERRGGHAGHDAVAAQNFAVEALADHELAAAQHRRNEGRLLDPDDRKDRVAVSSVRLIPGVSPLRVADLLVKGEGLGGALRVNV